MTIKATFMGDVSSRPWVKPGVIAWHYRLSEPIDYTPPQGMMMKAMFPSLDVSNTRSKTSDVVFMADKDVVCGYAADERGNAASWHLLDHTVSMTPEWFEALPEPAKAHDMLSTERTYSFTETIESLGWEIAAPDLSDGDGDGHGDS